ncbi:MAG TPA: trypsin-like peptidase domain-containing protein [Gemmataceae bacterium]|nr:trypsin-like peptidase domain-containing protein [Gemmataceae bacterium]
MVRSRVRLAIAFAVTLALVPSFARAEENVYKKALKSTVFIMAQIEGGIAMGSGSLIDADKKLILTNYHVVAGTKDLIIFFPRFDSSGKLIPEKNAYFAMYRNGSGYQVGKVFAEDKKHDLALIQIPEIPVNTPALKLAKDSPDPSDKVHSIGSPGASGAVFTYTEGSVKAVYNKKWPAGDERLNLQLESRVIETTSPTNHGDSGGPLMNNNAELVGVTQGGSNEKGANLINWFIDISEVKAFLKSKGIEPSAAVATGDNSKEKPIPKVDEKAKRETDALAKLDLAKKMKPEKAMEAFRDIVKNFAGTKAADEASKLMDRQEIDKKEADAATKLELAKDLAQNGKVEKAKERYREIIKNFPGTKAAVEAQKLLDK